MSNQKECFVLSPIGEEGTPTRERADKLLNHVIKKSVEQYDYEAKRADEIDEPGLITTQIIQHTVNAELVIADLTDANPNVFYELALRHASRNPIIQIIDEGDEIPFDVRNQRTIYIDIEDLDSVENAKDEIKQHIQAIESKEADANSPVSVAMDLQFWQESEDPQQQELAEVIQMITELSLDITHLQSQIDAKLPDSERQKINSQDFENLEHRLLYVESQINDLKSLIEKVMFSSKEKKGEVTDKLDLVDKQMEKAIAELQQIQEIVS